MRQRSAAAAALSVVLLLLLPVAAGHPAPAPSHFPASSAPSGAPSLSGRLPHPLPHVVNPSVLASGQGRLVVTTNDPGVVPNDGLRTNLTAYTTAPMDPGTSFQTGVEETIGAYDAVFGFFQNNQYDEVPFFSVFTNTTNQPVHSAVWESPPLLTGGSYDFQLRPYNGSVWQLTVNGAVFGANLSEAQFDFATLSATWAGGISFSEISLYSGAPALPASLTASVAFAFHVAGAWHLPGSAQVVYLPGGGPNWGVEGRTQHGSLAPGTLVTGSSVSLPANGSSLWTGGPVPIVVTVTTPGTAVGLTTVPVSVRTTDSFGGKVTSVALFLVDGFGGSFTPDGATTGINATVKLSFVTPNVTANQTDPIRALVTTLGYVGSGSGALLITPAVPVTLVAGTASPAALLGGNVTLRWTAYDPSNQTLPNLYVAFATIGGTLSQSSGYTDTRGVVHTQFNATMPVGYALVKAIVAEPGYWGQSAANVTVTVPPAPAPPQPLYQTLLGIAIVLVSATLLFVYLTRRRRRRVSLPEMRLPRGPMRPSAPAPAEPPVSRTPP